MDAEFAPMFSRIRGDLPKVTTYLVFDGEVPDGMVDADALMNCAAPASRVAGGHRARLDDDLHQRYDG
ncbi:MAG: hypothetical protein R2694_15505 [Ilumatobacteraceae bacterium]